MLTNLNGVSPEFFDYFDVNCPLVSSYNPHVRRTVSLAEQLEQGQITFDVWSKFVDARKQVSVQIILCIIYIKMVATNYFCGPQNIVICLMVDISTNCGYINRFFY